MCTWTLFDGVRFQRALFLQQKMSDKCFKKCIGKPGTQLENSEQVRRPKSVLPTRLHSSVGRASQRYRRGRGFESRWSLRIFSGFKFETAYVTSQLWGSLSLVFFICSALIWSLCFASTSMYGWHTELAGRYLTISLPALVYTLMSPFLRKLTWTSRHFLNGIL